MFFRRQINENPFLYKIYFHAYRKHRGIRPPYFLNKTDLYFDGYPRSGNTFLQNLIGKSFPEIHSVHHLHKVAPIKIALRKSIPCFILIRNPYECVSSNYLKYFSIDKDLPKNINVNLLKRMVGDYINYYSYVNQVRNRVHIIQFKDLINNPVDIIERIRDSLNLSVRGSEIEKTVHQAIESYRGSTDTYGSSRPNQEKEREKTKLKEVLESMSEMDQATSLFDQFM